MREKLPGILVKYKQKNKDELNASGVSPEHTSVDKVLEEFSEKMEQADKLHNQTTHENAVTNAKKCLTRCSESPRKEAACIRDPCCNNKTEVWGAYIWNKKKSRSGSDTLVYLREKAEKDQELTINEMLLRCEELELRKKEIENSKQ